MKNKINGKITIPANTNPWPHELKVGKILALAGHSVKFIPATANSTADIYLDGIIFEIKSPKSNKINTIEHRIKDAINNQSKNLIIDSSRIKNMPDYSLQKWLIKKCKEQPQIKRMIFINKKSEIINIKVI